MTIHKYKDTFMYEMNESEKSKTRGRVFKIHSFHTSNHQALIASANYSWIFLFSSYFYHYNDLILCSPRNVLYLQKSPLNSLKCSFHIFIVFFSLYFVLLKDCLIVQITLLANAFSLMGHEVKVKRTHVIL